ncbi:hypothetical protein RhiirA5_436408 [Rhizophagus irregularis]|uniref:Reverse transcriptase domain-containing protein n=1 Tax=Rhizophagus irregularis TaxID=588596 RepID=A0A2N0NM02_9GLOM|nr:hypothetical protein RhiirA5_436408 [Rhizophagus irregularis]
MTHDLKEMITRVMENRREQIKIDSCQQILEDRIRMITDHEEVKVEVREHYKEWTAVRNFNEIAFNNHWKDEYEPLNEIDENIYTTLCEDVHINELNDVLKQVKNDKAAGASGIPYDFWKKSGDLTKNLLLMIINGVLNEENWPEDWKKGIIYPIKKTIDWNRDLSLTRPITLIETARKLAIKIFTNRLSTILAKNNILKGKNFAALKYESTFEPIKIVQSVIEDTNINKKEA